MYSWSSWTTSGSPTDKRTCRFAAIPSVVKTKSIRQRIDNLVKQVRELRQQATALDLNHVFQFESTLGFINPDTQRACRHCAPEGFLGQRVFLHQEVFTVVRPVEMV